MQKNTTFSKRNSKKRFGTFLIRFLLLCAISLVVILIIVGGLLYKRYSDWELQFNDAHLSTDFMYVGSDEFQESQVALTEKLTEFQNSSERVDFIELNPNELISLVHSTIQPENVEISPEQQNWQIIRYYVEPSQNSWEIYVEIAYMRRILPWITVQVVKDPIESAELYFSKVSIGDIDLDGIGLGKIRSGLNDGYSKALSSINESGYTGRSWQNIELEDDGIVIKGELLSQ